MIRVSVEVESETAGFTVAVQAESLLAALGAVKEHYPGVAARVAFPISPEEFFVGNAAAGPVVLEAQEAME